MLPCSQGSNNRHHVPPVQRPALDTGQHLALIHTADFADKLTLQLAKRFDSATAGLTRVIEGLESELSQPIEGQGVGAMAGEIRAFVRGMSDGERMGFNRHLLALINGS